MENNNINNINNNNSNNELLIPLDEDLINTKNLEQIEKILEKNNILEEDIDKNIKNVEDKIIDINLEDNLDKIELGIELSLIILYKKLSLKILNIDKYITLLENQIFNKTNLEELDLKQLLTLYNNLRLISNTLFKQISEIKDKINIEQTKNKLLLLKKKENENINVSNDELLSDIFDEQIIEKIINAKISRINKES